MENNTIEKLNFNVMLDVFKIVIKIIKNNIDYHFLNYDKQGFYFEYDDKTWQGNIIKNFSFNRHSFYRFITIKIPNDRCIHHEKYNSTQSANLNISQVQLLDKILDLLKDIIDLEQEIHLNCFCNVKRFEIRIYDHKKGRVFTIIYKYGPAEYYHDQKFYTREELKRALNEFK